MTAIFILFSFIPLMSYGFIFKHAKQALTKSKSMAWFERITGGLFIVMGGLLLQLKNNS
jgi:threonine/homoserine/homoserine lactone efflux protein